MTRANYISEPLTQHFSDEMRSGSAVVRIPQPEYCCGALFRIVTYWSQSKDRTVSALLLGLSHAFEDDTSAMCAWLHQANRSLEDLTPAEFIPTGCYEEILEALCEEYPAAGEARALLSLPVGE